MLTEITIADFFKLGSEVPVIDVRSPGEYDKGHIPGAFNIPLFSNEERAEVGTVYKQVSKEKAYELAYKFVNPKLEWYIDESRKVVGDSPFAVHCWRGGMRSRSFADHLNSNGFQEVYLIQGGYKAYRHLVLEFFERPLPLKILGGYSGSGKTNILNELKAMGEQIIDLEGMANHKGSAFGGLGMAAQPTVEQFENNLYLAFKQLDLKAPIWLEDESHMIGYVAIPIALYRQMREREVFFIKLPQEVRARHLVKEYAIHDTRDLAVSISRIRKRLGGFSTKQALEHLEQKNYYEVAMLALQFYDKAYRKGVGERDQERVISIELAELDHALNAKTLIQIAKQNERNQTH